MSEGKKVNLDAALKAWPVTDRPALEWDERAERIQARVAHPPSSAPSGDASRDTDLLRSPLPATAEEVRDSAASGTGPSSRPRMSSAPISRGASPASEGKMQSAERERDRKSLQDLARLASSPSLTPSLAPSLTPSLTPRAPKVEVASARPPEAKGTDSGIVDLKMIATLDPAAHERSKTTPLASAELFDDDVPTSVPPPSAARTSAAPGPVSRQPASSGAPFAQAVAQAVPQAPISRRSSAAPAPKAKGAWAAIAGIAAIGIAAGVAALMLRTQDHAPRVAVQPPPVAEPAAQTKPDTTKLAMVDNPQTAAVPNDKANSASGVDIARLPVTEAVTEGTKPKAATSKNRGSSPGVSLDSTPPPDPRLVAKDLPPTPDQSGTLSDALKKAAGANDSTGASPTPAATGPAYAAGSVPQKPSQGAVTGALGAVMQTARACLEPDDPISRASVVFESSGAVTSITVSGGAAGKPAEACIKSALGKAKVPPFAEPTYSANVTIRPN